MNKSKKKVFNKMLPINDMDVFSDDENESIISSQTCSSTFVPDIVIHQTCETSRLDNIMCISSTDSDSEADFEVQFKQQCYKSSLIQKGRHNSRQSNCKVKIITPQKDRQNKMKTSPKINIHSVEKVKIPVNSLAQKATEKNAQNKHRVVKKLFEAVPSTDKINQKDAQTDTQTDRKNQKSSENRKTVVEAVPSTSKDNNHQKHNDTGTQTDSKNQDSSKDAKITLRNNNEMHKEAETQTRSERQESSKNAETVSERKNTGPTPSTSQNDSRQQKEAGSQMNNNHFTNENTISTSKFNFKRPRNVCTQTEIDLTIDTSSDEEIVKRKIVQMQVSPPKRSKPNEEECPIIRLIEEHINKLEVAKRNLSEDLHCTAGKSSKYKDIPSKKPYSGVKTSTTPMKKSTITCYFKNNNTKSANSTTNTSPERSTQNSTNTTPIKSSQHSTNTTPIKPTPGTSSVKSNDKINKSPEKKESRYSKENHARVVENVKKIVNWVFENGNYKILFTKSETNLLQKLFDFPDIRLTILCIRLYTRQHKWYNLINLCEELNLTSGDFKLKEIYLALTADFVCSDYSGEKIEVLLDYLTMPYIKDISRSFKIRVLSNKQNMIKKLLDYSSKQCTLSSLKSADQILRDRVKEKLGICVKLKANVREILFRIHLLYSLTNPDLDTPNDIYNLMYKIRSETVKFPKVKIDSALLFSDRQDFLKFTEACVLRKEFYDQMNKKDIQSSYLLCIEAHKRLKYLLSSEEQLEFDKKKPMFLRRFSAAWVYCKVLTSGSQNMGKSYPHAVCDWLLKMLEQEVYCIRSRGHWYSQLALVTKAHKKDIMGEAQIIVDGLSDKYVNEVQKHDLSIRGSKIRKGKISQLLHDELQCVLLPETIIPISRTIQANVVHNNEPGKKLQFERNTVDGKVYGSVEETAINYYITEENYTHGIHCEGKLLDAIFIILFWDILYEMHIPNTFITELQNCPLDLYSGEFYSNRENKINERLKNIRDDWTLDTICEFASQIYSEHSLELKSTVNFDFVEEDTFHIIFRSVGKKLLAAILERFAKDYKQFHSGLPDLFLWNKEYKCCFVEVKSENDRLSTKQLLWINYLHKFGAKVEVCHVEHISSRFTKKLKKQEKDV